MRASGMVLLLLCAAGLSAEPSTSEPLHLATADRSYSLWGTWKFIPRDSPDFASPLLDDGSWSPIRVPGLWNLQGYDHSGAAWFRRSFTVEPSMAGKDLSIFVPKVVAAYEAYLNGVKIGGQGRIGADGTLERENSSIDLIEVKADLLRDQNLLAFRVCSLSNDGGFLSSPFAIGGEASLRMAFHRYLIRYAAITAILLFVGIYHLILFSANRKLIYNLYFGLMAVAAGFLSLGQKSLGYWITDDPWINLYIMYVPLTLAPWLMFNFVHAFYERRRNLATKAVQYAYLLQLALLPLLPFNAAVYRFFFETIAIVVYGSLLLAACYLIALTFMAITARVAGAKIIAIGSIIFSVTSCLDILGTLGVPVSGEYMAEGFLALSVCMSVAVAARVSALNRNLDAMNTELERRNRSLYRFVPIQFFTLLNKKDILEINPGDSRSIALNVLFSDIRNFNGISERLSCADTFSFLNEYLGRVIPIVQAHEGFVDKYIGDAVMALYHNTDKELSAEQCISSAIEIYRETKEAATYFEKKFGVSMNIGIGVNSGELMLGTVGNTDRIDTTVIGKAVNLASRLEGLTKQYRVPIIISANTYTHIDPDRFHIRELDQVIVKGSDEPVDLFEVFEADPPQLREAKHATMPLYLQGIQLYRARRFREALQVFGEIEKTNPLDTVAGMYSARCNEYLDRPEQQGSSLSTRFETK